MKTGLRIAALVLTVVVSPRMATADAFLLQRPSQESAAEPAVPASTSPEGAPGCARGREVVTDDHDQGSHLAGIPKRGWGIPRRWKVKTRAKTGRGQERITPVTPGNVGTTAKEIPRAETTGGEPRGQPRTRAPNATGRDMVHLDPDGPTRP